MYPLKTKKPGSVRAVTKRSGTYRRYTRRYESVFSRCVNALVSSAHAAGHRLPSMTQFITRPAVKAMLTHGRAKWISLYSSMCASSSLYASNAINGSRSILRSPKNEGGPSHDPGSYRRRYLWKMREKFVGKLPLKFTTVEYMMAPPDDYLLSIPPTIEDIRWALREVEEFVNLNNLPDTTRRRWRPFEGMYSTPHYSWTEGINYTLLNPLDLYEAEFSNKLLPRKDADFIPFIDTFSLSPSLKLILYGPPIPDDPFDEMVDFSELRPCPFCGDGDGPGKCTEQANCLNVSLEAENKAYPLPFSLVDWKDVKVVTGPSLPKDHYVMNDAGISHVRGFLGYKTPQPCSNTPTKKSKKRSKK